MPVPQRGSLKQLALGLLKVSPPSAQSGTVGMRRVKQGLCVAVFSCTQGLTLRDLWSTEQEGCISRSMHPAVSDVQRQDLGWSGLLRLVKADLSLTGLVHLQVDAGEQ